MRTHIIIQKTTTDTNRMEYKKNLFVVNTTQLKGRSISVTGNLKKAYEDAALWVGATGLSLSYPRVTQLFKYDDFAKVTVFNQDGHEVTITGYHLNHSILEANIDLKAEKSLLEQEHDIDAVA